MTTTVPTNIVELIEACYRLEVSDDEWLRGIVDAATPVIDRGMGAAAYVFDARDAGAFEMLNGCFPPGVDMAAMRAFLSSVPADFVQRTWSAGPPTAYASEIEGFEMLAPTLANFGGARDVLAVNGRDPTGYGVWLGTLMPALGVPSEKERALFTRVAAHLVASYRVRRRLAGETLTTENADAVLRADGHIEHARGEAEDSESRDALRDATIGFDKARTKAMRADPDRALDLWQGLVDARWSLLDHFDRDGKHYVVARRNDAAVAGFADLTERERQVVAYASLGHDNKVIAYELGLADSTVRVLLHRAAAKVGVKGRDELIAAFKKASEA
jgi:DNA-binding CsgD family transcriptional regulator